MDPGNPNQSPYSPFPHGPSGRPQGPFPPPDRTPRSDSARARGLSSIPLFRIFGISVFLHWSWFIVAIYEIQDRRQHYDSLLWNVAEYLALFAIVLLHEFGHALACRSVGGKADRITLWPLGGVAFVSPPPRAGAVLWSIAAGPLVNALLLPILWVLHTEQPATNLEAFLYGVCWTNIFLLAFNMLPIYPLDGGQILQSLLWFVVGRGRSLMIAAWIGVIGAAVLGGFVLYRFHGDNLLTVAITVFMGMMAWSGVKNARKLLARENAPRRPDAICPNCGKNPPIGAFWGCACGNQFDTFATGAICPRCGAMYRQTQCLDCGKNNPLAAWMPFHQVPAAGTFTPFPTSNQPQGWISQMDQP